MLGFVSAVPPTCETNGLCLSGEVFRTWAGPNTFWDPAWPSSGPIIWPIKQEIEISHSMGFFCSSLTICHHTFLAPQAQLSIQHLFFLLFFFSFFLISLFLFNLALLIVIFLVCYVTTISIEVFSRFFFFNIYNSSSFQFTYVEFIVLTSCFTLSYFYVFLKLLIYLILFYIS